MHGLIIHVIWIAGTRMKKSGIDGLSRGDFLEGMMAGQNPLSFVPLNKDANEQMLGHVETWIRHWWVDEAGKVWNGLELQKLSPEDWFSLHTIQKARLWLPPPAAMETVVELFNEDRLAYPCFPMFSLFPAL